MNSCVNALLTAYLAAPLRGVGFAVFVRLWGVYGRSGGGSSAGGLGLCGLGVWLVAIGYCVEQLQGGVRVRESINIFDI